MINLKNAKRFCREDISAIENYENAVSDKCEMWVIHHKCEHLPCGNFSKKDLIDFGLYYGRPASELVFMKRGYHQKMHVLGERNPRYGKVGTFSGKHHSEETKLRLSTIMNSDETRKKISDKLKSTGNPMYGKKGIEHPVFGFKWFNNGVENVFRKECPEGFVHGRL